MLVHSMRQTHCLGVLNFCNKVWSWVHKELRMKIEDINLAQPTQTRLSKTKCIRANH